MEMVSVFWNLHKHLWSVRNKVGRVVMYATNFHMTNCKFVVWEGGRQRTIKQQAKEIHAFVKGDITDGPLKPPDDWIRVRYNPYEVSTFVTANDGKPVYSAAAVVMCADGKVFVKEPGHDKV